MEKYALTVCGLKRELPLVAVGRNTKIASFSLLGDQKLVEAVAGQMAKRLGKVKFDYLVGPEVKVVPLVSELARRLGHERFVVCRKSVKPYMFRPVVLKPLPHFPKHVRQLVIDGADADLLAGKRVAVIDDVVSTGVTMRMMAKLMEKVGAKVAVFAAVLKQGEQFDEMPELLTLAQLPVFHLD